MRYFFARRPGIVLPLILLAATSSIAQQTPVPPASPGSSTATASAKVTEGPTIQYADDQFAVITWTTDQPSPSRIQYGKDATLKQVADGGTLLGTSHRVSLRNLQPNTSYYFRVDGGSSSADQPTLAFQTVAIGGTPIRNRAASPMSAVANNSTASTNGTQSTSTNPASNISLTRGPVIQYLDDTTAVISWTTNIPASNTVFYGDDRTNLLYTAGTFDNVVDHRVHVANLKPNTTYYFQFDEGPSQVGTFRTIATGGQPQYDQQPGGQFAVGSTGSTSGSTSSPKLTRRERGATNWSTLPSGTQIDATLETALSTKTTQTGERFTALVSAPICDSDDNVIIPKGSRISGQVTESEQGKNLPQFRGRGKMNLRFVSITLPQGVTMPISATLISLNQHGGTGSVTAEGEVQSGPKLSTVVAGTGVGAGIGGIAGLLIGGPWRAMAIGALAGGGYILASKGKDVELPQYSEIRIRLDQNVPLASRTSPGE